jgi:uncharacterized damage-inducible protein DinB
MYRKIEDFLSQWKYESESTLKLFGRLNDAALDRRVTPDGRSLRHLAWHITTTLNEMMGQAGLTIAAPMPDMPAPAHVNEIIDAYRRGAASLAEAVERNWDDVKLTECIPMYGESWSRGYTLTALVAHQTHHRAQMTVLMRQAGLTVPGVYGPSREEWIEMGMEAMA